MPANSADRGAAAAHATQVERAVRIIGLVVFAAWTASHMREPDGLLHGSLLIFHEAGHVLFMPFGEFMSVLGGSLFQLMVPAFFVGYFAHRKDFYAACFAGLYLAASFADLGVYIADARAGDLPLIGGDRANHDWTFLLIELKQLNNDVRIGGFVRALGVLVYCVSLLGGLRLAWDAGRAAPQARPSVQPRF